MKTLEQAAVEWVNSLGDGTYGILDAFKAGAEWQKEQDEDGKALLYVNDHAYKKGFKDGKMESMKQNENYEKIKRDLAISFMHYLDEIRPEGKMCLSNGECADIDKAFDEMDWDKLARYLEKQRVMSKEFEQEYIKNRNDGTFTFINTEEEPTERIL